MNNFSRFQMNAYLWRNYVTRRNKYRWRYKRAYASLERERERERERESSARYFGARDLFPLISASRLYQGDRIVLCKVTRSV